MLNDGIEINQFKKKTKKNKSQLMLIFETCDSGHELNINLQKVNHKK